MLKKLFSIFLIVIILLPKVGFSATDVKNDATLSTSLVSYWELEESSGTRVDSHASNDLGDFNTVLSNTGIIGTSADFERSNGEYLSISDATQSGLDFTGDVSFNLWVNFEAVPASGAQYSFVSKFLTTGNQRSYIFYAVESGGTITLNWLSYTNGLSGSTATVTWAPSTATWYMLTMTYDASAGEVKFYVNGSQQGSTQTGHATSIYNGSAPFDLGDTSQFGTLGHDGEMDEVGAWSKVLTSTEITDLYNSGSGIPYEAGGGGEEEATTTPSAILRGGMNISGEAVVR